MWACDRDLRLKLLHTWQRQGTCEHVTCLLASDWLRVITWTGSWPLIGWVWSRDLDTGLSLVRNWEKVGHWAPRSQRVQTDSFVTIRMTAEEIIIKSNWIYLQTQRIRVWRSVLSIRPVCKSLFNRQWMVCGQWERKILRSQLSSEERTTVSKIFSRLGLWLETVGDWWLHHILETIIRWSPLQHCAWFRFYIRITKELN